MRLSLENDTLCTQNTNVERCPDYAGDLCNNVKVNVVPSSLTLFVYCLSMMCFQPLLAVATGHKEPPRAEPRILEAGQSHATPRRRIVLEQG